MRSRCSRGRAPPRRPRAALRLRGVPLRCLPPPLRAETAPEGCGGAEALQQLKSYVQNIVDANVENGASIIASAGFAVRKSATRVPRVFAAKPGKVSGTAALVAAPAAKRSAYEWEYSTDGGKTWVVTPSTLQAKSTIVGLTPGSTVVFRYRAVTKTGEGDWSQVVSLIIK